MNILNQYDNFIFDLYGTLVDLESDEQCARTWKKWCKWLDLHGIKHPEYIQFRKEFFMWDKKNRETALLEGPYKYPEIDVIDIYRTLFRQYGNEGISEDMLFMASYAFREASIKYIRLFDGVTDFLEYLNNNGKKTYILSNAQASYTEPEIKHFQLDGLVDDYLMSSDYKCMKPEKAFFDKLILKYDMDRQKTVMLGDSLSSDVIGAEKAGINHIHLYGSNRAEEFYVNQLHEWR